MEGLSDSIYDSIKPLEEAITNMSDALTANNKPLNMDSICRDAIQPYIKANKICEKIDWPCSYNITMCFIRAVTMGVEDDITYWKDNYVFICPQQWKLLNEAHKLEIEHWFVSGNYKTFDLYEKTTRGFHSVFFTFERVERKAAPSEKELVLELVFRIGFDRYFYHGTHCCQAVYQHFEDIEDGECDKEQTKCIQCNMNVVCKIHEEEWGSKTVCRCLNK